MFVMFCFCFGGIYIYIYIRKGKEGKRCMVTKKTEGRKGRAGGEDQEQKRGYISVVSTKSRRIALESWPWSRIDVN